MKGIKSFYIRAFFIALVVGIAGISLVGVHKFNFDMDYLMVPDGAVEETDFGRFLAAQHALYINDFDAASNMIKDVKSEIVSVEQVKIFADFFSGKMPENVSVLKSDKDLPNKLIYDAYLIQNNNWTEVYKRHASDKSVLNAPIRIFSAVKQGKTKEALKFIDSLSAEDNWKAFVRGQIAVLNNDIDGAAKEFAKVEPAFMNLNDYMYLMSFYNENEMFEDVDILRADFTDGAKGMFLLNYEDIPDWSEFSGYENNLAFSLIQYVSHMSIMMYTDVSVLLLRVADAISDTNQDALNYFIGLYYINNSGDYEQSFNNISGRSPWYLFAQQKMALKRNDMYAMERLAGKNPLFTYATEVVLKHYVKTGNKKAAMNLLNTALKTKNLSDSGRVYFLKNRANVCLLFNDTKCAQSDIDEILDIDYKLLSEVTSLQARTWNQKDINLVDAYDYIMNVIKRNPSNVFAWDVLSLIVEKREGLDAALELLEHVGEISALNISSVYEHLGDMYVKKGEIEKAKKSYLLAIDLADDGLVVVPVIQKKIRKLK